MFDLEDDAVKASQLRQFALSDISSSIETKSLGTTGGSAHVLNTQPLPNLITKLH